MKRPKRRRVDGGRTSASGKFPAFSAFFGDFAGFRLKFARRRRKYREDAAFSLGRRVFFNVVWEFWSVLERREERKWREELF
jgi:hypothetical protein